MSDQNSGDTFDTDEVYQRPSISIKIRKLLESKYPDGMSPKNIYEHYKDKVKNKRTVYSCLQRLKKKNLAENKNRLWYSTKKKIPPHATTLRDIDTDKGSGGQQPYQSSAAFDVARQIFDYNAFHAFSCHLPAVSTDTEWSVKMGKRHYHLEQRKFHMKATMDPLPIEDSKEVETVIRLMCDQIGYDGPIWVNVLELNNDMSSHRLDGLQRVEMRTVLGNVHRLYNKKMSDGQVLRAESRVNFKRGKVDLNAALFAINSIGHTENAATVLKKLTKKSVHAYTELSNARHKLGQVRDDIKKSMEFNQSQMLDNNAAISEVQQTAEDNQYLLQSMRHETRQDQDIQRAILKEISSGNEMAERQRSETNSRLGIQINQTDEILSEVKDINDLTEQVQRNQISWKQLKDDLKYEVFRELRKQRYTLHDIAKMVGYASRSGLYNWLDRNGFDTDVNKVVNTTNTNDNDLDDDMQKLIQQSDTVVNKSILHMQNLKELYSIDLDDTVPTAVEKLIRHKKTLTSKQAKQILSHIPPGQVASRLSDLAATEKVTTQKADPEMNVSKIYIWVDKKGDEK